MENFMFQLMRNCTKGYVMKRNIILLLLIMNLNACVPLMIGAGAGAGALGGKIITQDKTVGESVSDSTIWTKIRAGFVREKIEDASGINVEVDEGRVLLTGFAHNSQDIIKVLKVVWEQNGVKEVINEIKVKSKENDTGIFEDARDGWITTQIKTKLLFASDIKSANYSVETINSVVYLFGIAHSSSELDKVKKIADDTSSVKKVVSYIRIRKDLESRLEDTKGNKPVSEQEKLNLDSLEDEVSGLDQDKPASKKNIFDEEEF